MNARKDRIMISLIFVMIVVMCKKALHFCIESWSVGLIVMPDAEKHGNRDISMQQEITLFAVEIVLKPPAEVKVGSAAQSLHRLGILGMARSQGPRGQIFGCVFC